MWSAHKNIVPVGHWKRVCGIAGLVDDAMLETEGKHGRNEFELHLGESCTKTEGLA